MSKSYEIVQQAIEYEQALASLDQILHAAESATDLEQMKDAATKLRRLHFVLYDIPEVDFDTLLKIRKSVELLDASIEAVTTINPIPVLPLRG